ncbi:hypothetical protein CYLTODRAFT_424395 [Cylindrobasidium torrendii FP15055 ss-10]|uniref:Uncharacterized protein n=1 Tax=Cylindrobasidium torrendii FP15055 ss-10 TaxID=1314674 RepID=A0A0D7B5A2_9AGAR|nr:hypothetical protein CYLTODRAFT_424395 [Cylindrobasidium torrendii FP15055 ss-10]
MTCERCGLSTKRPARTVENPTPFPEYFGQNVCVEPATAGRVVADFLYNAKKEEEEMASDIRTLEASLAQMKAEHAAAKVFIAKHEALLSRVHRLPNEILEQIFLFLPAAFNMSTIPFKSRGDFDKWHITWVCRQWRSVAIQATQLWNRISLGDRNHAEDNISSLLELSLSRTRGLLPLFLDISTGQMRATYAIILKYAAHIRFLKYRIYHEERGIPDDLEGHFESLQELEVVVDCERGLFDEQGPMYSDTEHDEFELSLDEYLSRFRLCTSLEVLDLRINTHSNGGYASHVDVTPKDVRFPWHSLRVFRLRVEDQCFFPLPDILAACQTLETLVVDGYKGTRFDEESDVLVLPRLTYVRLTNSLYVTTLPTFNVPSLRTLCLEGSNSNFNAPGPSSLFHSPHRLSTLRLRLSDILVQWKWKNIVVKMQQPLRRLQLQMGRPNSGKRPYFPSGQPAPVLPLARKVRLDFPCHIEGRFEELIPWVRCGDHLESLTLVFREWDSAQIRQDCYNTWREDEADCEFPTYDEAEEWAEQRLVASDFISQLKSLASTGVTVEMILQEADGSSAMLSNIYT